MDRKKHKKIRSARVIMTNIFMGLSVVAIVFVLMLIAMGYSFSENGGLEQSGLVQIASSPSGALVEIDGNTQFSRTELNKMLAAGVHRIKISKPGYDTWEKTLRVDAGLLTRVEWVRLFPLNPKLSTVYKLKTPRLVSVSSDRRRLLLSESDSTLLTLIDLQSEEAKRQSIPLSSALGVDAVATTTGSLSVTAWNESCNKVLLRWAQESGTSWHLVDLDDASKSINISAEFSLDFSSIRIANDSASKLWALENGNLRLLDASAQTVTNVLASNISTYASNADTVAYLNVTDGQYRLQLYRDGEAGATTIKDFKDSAPDGFLVALGSYWGKDWLAYTVGQQLEVLSGNYPSFKKNSVSNFNTIHSRKLNFAPLSISVNPTNRLIALTHGAELTSYDLETRDYFDSTFDSDGGAIRWLDDYLLWENASNKIIVRDFDGDNRRTLFSLDNQFPVALSENNQYLYYFEKIEPETSESETTETSFALKREQLKI